MTTRPDRLGHTLQWLPDAVLADLRRGATRRYQAGFALVALAILAGIWVDWRWLPTGILPLIYAALYLHISGRATDTLQSRGRP